ncbi:MAG: transporter substrate-binding domain-containing protein [Synergistaceae bacterium]|nr:transporter substrate-binding domain-containing protein [Synergistaceae bacterium]MBQ7267951.1 transporter substrate-binding domain-containing protein [Synergistaceae bacterium]
MKNMKYIILSAVVVLIVLAVYITENPEGKTSKQVLRIGVECDYAPNNWEEKEPTDFNVPLSNFSGLYAEGYDIQMAKLVADKLNFNLEVKKIAWENLIPALQNGEIDAIFSGMLDTDQRKELVAFTEPYEVHKTEYVVVVNKNSPYADAERLTDFHGAKFTGQKDTNLYASISQLPGAIAEPAVDTVPEMLDKVISGKVDGIVINLDTGRSYEAAHSVLKVIKFPEDEGFVIGFTGICAALRKDDTELLGRINRILDDLKRSERQKIMDDTVARLIHGMSNM